MPTYEEFIRKGVVHHQSCDASSWPSYVSEFAQSLQNELKVPHWFKEDLAKCSNAGGTDRLGQLCLSDDANSCLWESSDGIMDGVMKERVRMVFNTALADCARIRAVMEVETLTGIPYSKESFLVILVRNAMLEAHERLSSLEDVPVVLPRHPSGEEIPLLGYMKQSLYAPLVVSVIRHIPITKSDESELGEQLGDEENSSYEQSASYAPYSMSEFLNLCERPQILEEEREKIWLSPQFEAYCLAYSPPATPPSTCHIPVLCMADVGRLPILMTSLLYQRRVWRIMDPLVALQFSKNDTTIRLFVGWLEDDESSTSSYALPRAHIGEIGTPVMLDLSSPSVVLVVSRLLCSLHSHIRGVRDVTSHYAGAVIDDMQSDPSLSWRIDTDRIEGCSPIPENHGTQDMIIRWLKTQSYLASEESAMQTRQQAKKTSSVASSTPHGSTSERFAQPPPTSSTPLTKASSVVELQTSNAKSHACSRFAATGQDASNVFRWMFDRGVVPQPVTNDVKFREEYSEMTCLIWPERWNTLKDLPFVDTALNPYREELLGSIQKLKESRPNAVKCFSEEDFPVNLSIFEGNFSAILQASRRSREKTELLDDVCEADWRHDHDRLLFDFFVRLVQPNNGDAIETTGAIANPEDPSSRPTLEVMLRLPKTENMHKEVADDLIPDIILHQATDAKDWLQRHQGTPTFLDREHAAYAVLGYSSWAREYSTRSKNFPLLSQAPLKGVCDALGCLLIKLPGVSPDVVRKFQLVSRATKKKTKKATVSSPQASGMIKEEKVSNSALSRTSGSSTTNETAEQTTTYYTMLSSSTPVSTHCVDNKQTDSSGLVAGLVDGIEQLHLDEKDVMGAEDHKDTEEDTTDPSLELPVLIAEYKKTEHNSIKGTNQLRMYLTAAVKFLKKLNITNFPVYGVQTDGPIVVLPAAILRDDNLVYLYERLTARLDISEPLGAWHYATILGRLAQNHASMLRKKFEQVSDDVVGNLRDVRSDEMADWTMSHERAKWEREGLIKKQPKAKKVQANNTA